MGDFLKKAYDEDGISKALSKIDSFINQDYQKLSDKYKDLKLSHNRKKFALKQILEITDDQMIIDICKRALFCDSRVKGVF